MRPVQLPTELNKTISVATLSETIEVERRSSSGMIEVKKRTNIGILWTYQRQI